MGGFWKGCSFSRSRVFSRGTLSWQKALEGHLPSAVVACIIHASFLGLKMLLLRTFFLPANSQKEKSGKNLFSGERILFFSPKLALLPVSFLNSCFQLVTILSLRYSAQTGARMGF